MFIFPKRFMFTFLEEGFLVIHSTTPLIIFNSNSAINIKSNSLSLSKEKPTLSIIIPKFLVK
jgi:hypothetical protein